MAFKYGDHVRIIPMERHKGRVVNVFVDERLGPEYEVRYFMNGEAKTCRFFADEIEAAS